MDIKSNLKETKDSFFIRELYNEILILMLKKDSKIIKQEEIISAKNIPEDVFDIILSSCEVSFEYIFSNIKRLQKSWSENN